MIVVSDGGSADKTVSIAKTILSQSNVPYKLLLTDTQLPVAQNFEKALKECDTDLIFFSDQDDVWLEKKIEYTASSMVESCELIFSDAYVVDSDLINNNKTLWQKVGYHPDNHINVYKQYDTSFFNELLEHNVVTGMCMCITKTLRDIALPFPEKVLHDYWLALLGINKGAVVSINEPLVLYRQHSSNVVGTSTTFKKSFVKRKGYLNKLQAKESMFIRLKKIVGKDSPESNIYQLICEYVAYLACRINYIKHGSVFEIINNISGYTRYEHRHWRIIMRDVFAKVYMNTKGNR